MAGLLSKSKEAVTESLTKATAAMSVQDEKGVHTRSSELDDRAQHRRTTAPATSSGRRIYVNEAIGSDEVADGSQKAPFQTLLGAYTILGTTDLDLYTRKASPPGANEVESDDALWQPASASGLKKAKKGYEMKLAKAAKESERIEREEAERQRKVAAVKGKHNVEPADAPTAKRIKIWQATEAREAGRVRIFGWTHRLRQQSGLTFLVISDGEDYLQCVIPGKLVRRGDLIA